MTFWLKPLTINVVACEKMTYNNPYLYLVNIYISGENVLFGLQDIERKQNSGVYSMP